MIVAQSITWGFALPALPEVLGPYRYELLEVPGITTQRQYCRVRIADQDVWVMVIADRASPDVAAMRSRLPDEALAIIVDDTRDRPSAYGVGIAPTIVAAAVAISRCNGSLDDPWPMIVEVDGVEYEAIAGFRNRDWFATVRAV